MGRPPPQILGEPSPQPPHKSPPMRFKTIFYLNRLSSRCCRSNYRMEKCTENGWNKFIYFYDRRVVRKAPVLLPRILFPGVPSTALIMVTREWRFWMPHTCTWSRCPTTR